MGALDVIENGLSYIGLMDPKRAKITMFLYDNSQKQQLKPGSTDKTAAIKVSKPVKIGGGGAKGSMNGGVDVSGAKDALQKGADAVAGAVKDAAGAIASSEEPGKVVNGPQGKRDGKDYTSLVFNVLFNPESLQITASGGGFMEEKNYNKAKDGKNKKGATETINYTKSERRNMRMSVKLLFDKTDENYAFSVLDPFSISLTGSTIKNVGKNLFNLKNWELYSVREEVEGFLASIQSDKTNLVRFEWGDMSYEGLVFQVDANYTMFNPDGSPCRAEVYLSMILIDNSYGYDFVGEMFNRAFEKEFGKIGKGISLDSGDVSWNTFNNKAGSLIHF